MAFQQPYPGALYIGGAWVHPFQGQGQSFPTASGGNLSQWTADEHRLHGFCDEPEYGGGPDDGHPLGDRSNWVTAQNYQRQRRVQRPGNMSAGTRSAGARPRRNAAGLIDGPSGPRPPGDDDSDDGGAGGASGPSVSSTTRHPSPVLPTAEPYKAPGATSAAPATNPQQITLEQSRTVNRRVARNPSGQAANMSAVDTHQLDKNWIVRLTEFFEKHKDKVLEGSSVHLIERHALNDGTVGYLTSSNLCFFIGYLGDRKDSLEGSMHHLAKDNPRVNGDEFARGTFDAMLAAAKRMWEDERALGSPIETNPTAQDGPVTNYKKKLRALLQRNKAATAGAAGVDYMGNTALAAMEAMIWKPWSDVMNANLLRVPPGQTAGPNAALGIPPKPVEYSDGVGSEPKNIPNVCSAAVTQLHCILAVGAHNAARGNEMRQLPTHSISVMYGVNRPSQMQNVPSMKHADVDLYGRMSESEAGLVPVLVQLHSPWTKQGTGRNTDASAGGNGVDTVSTWFPSDTPEVCPHLALAMQLRYGVALGQRLPISRKEHGAKIAGDDFPLLRGNLKTKGSPAGGYAYLDQVGQSRDMDILLAYAGVKEKGMSTHIVRHRFGEMNAHVSSAEREKAGHWKGTSVHNQFYESVALLDWDLALALANRKNADGHIDWLFTRAPDPGKYWAGPLRLFPEVVGMDPFEKDESGEFVFETTCMRALIRTCQWFNSFAPRQLAALYYLCPALRDICWFRDGLVPFIKDSDAWNRYLDDAREEFEADVVHGLRSAEDNLRELCPNLTTSVAACFEAQTRLFVNERHTRDQQHRELRAEIAELRRQNDEMMGLLTCLSAGMLPIMKGAMFRRAGDGREGGTESAQPMSAAASPECSGLQALEELLTNTAAVQEHQPLQQPDACADLYITHPNRPGCWWHNDELWTELKIRYDRAGFDAAASLATAYVWPISDFTNGKFTGPGWPSRLHHAFNKAQTSPPDPECPAGQIHPPVMWLFGKLPSTAKRNSRGASKGLPDSTALSGGTSSDKRIKNFRKCHVVYEHLLSRHGGNHQHPGTPAARRDAFAAADDASKAGELGYKSAGTYYDWHATKDGETAQERKKRKTSSSGPLPLDARAATPAPGSALPPFPESTPLPP